MTAATTTPTTALAIWWAIPQPVRAALRARVPLDCRDHGRGGESLIVSVGSGCPLRWLEVRAEQDGSLSVRLWEVRRTVKELTAGSTTADHLAATLQRLARDFNLGG